MPNKALNTAAYPDNRVKAGVITCEDADLILEYCDERKATEHTTNLLVIAKTLTQFGILLAPYKKYTPQNIIKVINAVTWKQNTRRLRAYRNAPMPCEILLFQQNRLRFKKIRVFSLLEYP